MHRIVHARFMSLALALIAVIALFGLSNGSATAATLGKKAVFVMSNNPGANAVLAFNRAGDGSLTPAGSFPTGGMGAAGLGSQGALTLSDDGRWLFAVNGGSNDVSVLDADNDMLAVVSRMPSGGIKPVSVTAHQGLVYALNAGETANISGFRLDPHGRLHPIAGSTKPLSAANPGGAEVAFTPDGKWLVVSEKTTQKIDTYAVDANGVAQGPVVSPSSGMTPFGFGIDKRGHVIVSEAGTGAVSSYSIAPNGQLNTISPSVVDVGQGAACWIAVDGNGRYAYAANAASGTLTGFKVAQDGSLTLLNANAITAAPGGKPLDMAFSENNQYLYVFNATQLRLNTYHVQEDGSLVWLGDMAGFSSTPTATGIAAR